MSSSFRKSKGGKASHHQQSPVGELHAKYRDGVKSLAAVFPGWSNDDLAFVLDEASGDLELATTRILEGHAQRWTDTKTKKEKKSDKKLLLPAKELAQSHFHTTSTTSTGATDGAAAHLPRHRDRTGPRGGTGGPRSYQSGNASTGGARSTPRGRNDRQSGAISFFFSLDSVLPMIGDR
ncbi:hypothetical protein AMAG_20220 [Allomyces macrogynus ATCC 38327]|uniref:RNA polymerase II degradation factor 1 n=1 Tax=Allomyces macrogynus (strain ATCC 38327) TaxID=578462 RepID=A0A0L0T5H2_ALLM3|nr:hypothetical protein AMAG_20220 [Allomyces macrogynus ATCC 38327]|eukprot:KNE70038.1 hypothetical protein AMAG_20220 [Allomyces macrogynus ATCC 38327]